MIIFRDDRKITSTLSEVNWRLHECNALRMLGTLQKFHTGYLQSNIFFSFFLLFFVVVVAALLKVHES